MVSILKGFKAMSLAEKALVLVFSSIIIVAASSLIYALVSGQIGANNLGNF